MSELIAAREREGSLPPGAPGAARESSGKPALLNALVPAVVTIAVAGIGILPSMRNKDEEIKALHKQLQEIQEQLGSVPPPGGGLETRWSIRGTIKRADMRPVQGRFDVYLVPGNNFMAMPGTDGGFRFDAMLTGSYSIVVVDNDPDGHAIVRQLIDPFKREGSFDLNGASVQYSAQDEVVRTAHSLTPPRTP